MNRFRQTDFDQWCVFVALFTYGVIAVCGVSVAQGVEGDIPPPQPATFAGNIYGISPLPAVPRTAYDDQRQSVYILDGPAPMATSPSGASQAVYQPGQQFQLLDAPHSGASPVAYNTIEAPSLPPGAVVPEGYDHCDEPWSWQLMPDGLIWHSDLAGPKEPRIGGVLASDTGVDTKLDGTVGGRVGLLRYGDTADFRPQGWQADVEGAAFIRQDLTQNSDVDAYDFRIGFPVTYGWGDYQMKIAWYHTSAHIGDEYELKHPTFMRINYSRNAIVWGHGYFITPDLRIYSEFEWAYFAEGGSKPWAIQFGIEYNPVVRGWHGAPFFDINAYLKQENNWGGPLTVETGWQWRPMHGGQMVRTGFFYQTGPTIYGQFFQDSQQLIGYGLWYDY
ncbi:MAG TPA: DUF1207 domain-containing protein [Pirellulales bacterium]|nr:DUF1207 domain-containing protein [Pirellulales bacterium]